MPCRVDDWGNESYSERLGKQVKMLEAMLCASFRSAYSMNKFDELIKNIDWAEAGVTKSELLEWWNKHQREDEERREREHQEREREMARHRALSKLTKEERKLLGL